MGESLAILAILTVAAVVVFAVLVRMIAQVIKDSGHEKKVTECIASMNMLMTHIAIYNASADKSADQVAVINKMIEAWNQRYFRWRGFEKIPALVKI